MKNTIILSVLTCLLPAATQATGLAADELRFHVNSKAQVQVSTDAGFTWTGLNEYLNVENTTDLRYHLDSQSRLHYSTDAGFSWYILDETVRSRPELEAAEVMSMPIEKTRKDYPLFLHITGDGSAWVSLDGGYEWFRDETMDRQGHSTATPEIPADGSTMLRFQPHPLEGNAAAILAVREENLVALTLYDFNGRKVAVLAEGIFAAGEYRFPIETSALQRGVYSYSLQVGDTYEQGAVTVAR